MARAWIVFPDDPPWGDVQIVKARLRELDYSVCELRGVTVLLRVSGNEIEPGEALRMPGEKLDRQRGEGVRGGPDSRFSTGRFQCGDDALTRDLAMPFSRRPGVLIC